MSISSLQSSIERVQHEIADLQDRLSRATKKEADAADRIAHLHSSMSGHISASQMQSKLRELARHQDDAARAQKEQADLNKRIGDKMRDLHRYKADLAREEASERKRLADFDRRLQRERQEYGRDLNSHLLGLQSVLPRRTQLASAEVAEPRKRFDLFISHASEDKDEFARPLAEALRALSLAVWYDEFQLKVGDSLRRSIDRGLADSRFGVVVLSSAFFAKNWPQYELDGLVSKEIDGAKVILPIWHRVTKDEVMKYSPTLADRVAINSSILSVDDIARQLAEVATSKE